MIDLILVGIALALGGGGDGDAAPELQLTEAVPDFVAEPQEPTGKFTTAGEIKQIIGMTKGNWVAVREYNGQDLLYVTHLLSWRCGMHQIRYSLNDGQMQVWPMPQCYEGTNAPNAIKTEDGLPYVAQPLGSIQSVRVELLFDDLTEDAADFVRSDVLMP